MVKYFLTHFNPPSGKECMNQDFQSITGVFLVWTTQINRPTPPAPQHQHLRMNNQHWRIIYHFFSISWKASICCCSTKCFTKHFTKQRTSLLWSESHNTVFSFTALHYVHSHCYTTLLYTALQCTALQHYIRHHCNINGCWLLCIYIKLKIIFVQSYKTESNVSLKRI